MRFFDGSAFTFDDIDLESVPPATSVAEANSKFSDRAAAAILYGANTSLNADGENYGLRILAKMAYSDYFLGPDQIPGRNSSDTLRDEVTVSVENQKPSNVGTPTLFGGDYDILLTAYVKLYYRYYHALSTNAKLNLFNNLLSKRGKYDPGEAFALSLGDLGNIPETENHRLMIQSAKYLTNQLYYQASIAEGAPDHENFDNNRNGDGGSNPPMVDVILQMLSNFLTSDFIEYNSRPYQDLTMSALLNLVSFSYDDRVRLAARMVLDYVSAKVAVSSQDLRRCPPFRRRNEDKFFGPIIKTLTMPKGFLGSPLVYNFGPPPYEPDPQIAFYTMLAGNTGVLQSPPKLPFPNPTPGHAPGNYAFEMIHAGLSDYRVPPAILDLFVSRLSRTFYQGFHRVEGLIINAQFVRELYAGSPSYLISAGGNPSFFAYQADILGVWHRGNSEDLGLAMPTVFIPSVDCPAQSPGFGTTLADIIQFGRASTDFHTFNLGVAPNFACGGPMYVPDAFEPHTDDPTKPDDPKIVGDGNWTFVDRGSGSTGPGYYLAIFRVRNLFPTGEAWGILEAHDTLLSPLRFRDFQKNVKETNRSLMLQAGEGQVNTYTTQAGQRIQFTLAPRSEIISTSAEPDQSVYTSTFAHGSIINSGQGGGLIPVGTGLITISNPAVGTITLDMRSKDAAGDPLFGLHHPSRTSETGEVESAGANEEAWVDSNYPGTAPSAGDFGDPFRTLGQAITAVKVGGTVRIVNLNRPETPPVVYTKRMTLRAVGVTVTLPR